MSAHGSQGLPGVEDHFEEVSAGGQSITLDVPLSCHFAVGGSGGQLLEAVAKLGSGMSRLSLTCGVFI